MEQAVKAVDKVGRKAGLFASILGTIATLLPFKIPGLQDTQSSLKNFQQETNTAIGTVNTKVNAVNTLADQVGKLPGVDQLSSVAQNAGANAAARTAIIATTIINSTNENPLFFIMVPPLLIRKSSSELSRNAYTYTLLLIRL